MFAVKSARRALALGSALVATGAFGLVAAPQPAMAGTTVLNATVDCLNVNYSGSTSDWYPYQVSVYASPGGSVSFSPYAIPATHAYGITATLPSGTTSVTVYALCSSGHQWDLSGYGGVSVPSGATSVSLTLNCSTQPVYPGPWLTSCSSS
ncbi:hypothetical protein GCM10009530_45130 [Microbispora corallina]|uniref:Ig-like domain-containing protein n=1 Tax=Microbispora corallina TaxID=83302 RepID=A0ABQ4FWV0_9ACTN|nr:hypothetical protein [Microbispora corallina]GIH39228.1 hypothetical protein Mco01_22280 [Microbispora corallina]